MPNHLPLQIGACLKMNEILMFLSLKIENVQVTKKRNHN